jgi:TolB protein
MGIGAGVRRGQGSSRWVRGLTLGVVVALAAAVLAPMPAGATWPGANGRIAFDRAVVGQFESQIWTMNGVTNGHGVQLTTQGSNDSPSYSPNGGVIAFGSDRSGVPQIWLMGAGGGDQRNISPDGMCAAFPSFSPNGRSIVFVHYPDTTCDGTPDIWTVRRDGTDAAQLTNTSAQRELLPSYSPDGTKIVFSSHTGPGTFAVYTINANGSSRTRITPKWLDASWPDWSPDGTKLVFASNEGQPESNIWTIDPDGQNLHRVLRKPVNYNNTAPKWSPDGKQLLFTSDRFGDQLDLFSVRLSNGAIRRRGTQTPGTHEFGSSWQARN